MNFIAIIAALVQLTAAYGVNQRQAALFEERYCNHTVCNKCDRVVNYNSDNSSAKLVRSCEILLHPQANCCNSHIRPDSSFIR